MHLSLTCLYSYCFTVQKYAETTRNDYFYNGTCLLAALVFPLTTYYDYRLLLPANGRRDFFSDKARFFYISIFVFRIKCETEI
jgi:hypothetical protein